MIVSTGHSFRKILKNPKAPDWKQEQSKGAAQAVVTVPNQGQQGGSAGNVLSQGGFGRGKAEKITENLERFMEQFGVPCVSQDAEERGKRKQNRVKYNINNSVCLEHSPFLHKNNGYVLNNIRVSTVKQIMVEIAKQKCFGLVHLGCLVIFNLEQSFGFLFFSSEVLLALSSPALFL